MTKSIIFCAVFPMLLDLFFESPNFFSEPFALSPNLSRNFLAYHRRFSQNFCCLHRTFRPNFLRLQGTFRGYYLPCWLLLQQVFFRFVPVQIIECGVERGRFRLILRFFPCRKLGSFSVSSRILRKLEPLSI